MQDSDLRVGQVVRFHYKSDTGSRWRLVKVTELDGTHLKGYDLELPADGNFRNFSLSKIWAGKRLVANVDEDVVFPTEVVRKEFLPHIPASAIVDAYNAANRGKLVNVRWDSEACVLVVRRRVEPAVLINCAGSEVTIMFRNELGKEVGLKFNTPTPHSLNMDATFTIDAKQISDFADQLRQHCPLPAEVSTQHRAGVAF